jgi:imidazolonepropionase-like amidohydrolase
MEAPKKTLFVNSHLLLDRFTELHEGLEVLIAGDTIEAVSATPLPRDEANVIDAGGKTLMPGLIDAHAHITGLSLSPRNAAFTREQIIEAASHYLRASLMDGFTSMREAGGAGYTIARLLADGKIIGPRLFYSGRALTQTGGGADFRTLEETSEPCGEPGPFSVMSVIADGVAEVRRAAREELRRGASQIKVFVSGGVVFPSQARPTLYEYSIEELRAIVEEANARGTYVMAHVYTDEGVRRCLEAGVRSIEHGNFVQQQTVASMAEHGAYLDPTFISLAQRIQSADETGLPQTIVDNLKRTIEQGKRVYQWARRYQVPIGLGTDLWGAQARRSQLREFELRMELDQPVNVIRSATAVYAELLMQKGILGTIAPGARADLLIVEGNPLADLKVLTDPRRNLKLIMKDGTIYKNEL